MLSISNVTAGMAASQYYTRESYYAKEAGEAKAASAWVGEGAAAAGLEGQVDPAVFAMVMQGKVPNSDIQLGRVRDGEIEHAPGTDLTFSAPKSVSILALVVKDQRVIAAHDAAVKATLAYIEKNLIQTRVFKDGHVQEIGNQKMVAATFRQDTSRNLDPQLHTHSVIANMVQGEDGQWRSLHNPALYENKMMLGQFYRAELAAALERIGYECVVTHPDGRFEVAQVPAAAIEAFSTRSQDIREALSEYDNPTAKAAENAAIMTREGKREMSPKELEAEWRATARENGLDVDAFRMPGLDRQGASRNIHDHFQEFSERVKTMWQSFTAFLPSPFTLKSPEDAVRFAVDHLSEREAAFKASDLLTTAMAHSFGAYTPTEIIGAINRLEESGRLLRSEKQSDNYKGTFTIPAAARIEHEIEHLVAAGVGKGKVIMNKEEAVATFSERGLNPGQVNAAAVILSAPDRNVNIQGFAGVGKTTMVNRVREVGEQHGVQFIGLSPTASAAGTLEQETKIPSQTVQSFLMEYGRVNSKRYDKAKLAALQEKFKNTVVVIDEASFLSNAQERELLRIMNTLGVAKKVELGDEKQHGSVEAGKPFSRAQDKNITGARMTDIRRQQNPDLLLAVKYSIVNQVEKAFAKIGASNIIECDYKEKGSPESAAAAAWLELSPADRAKTLIVTQNRQQRATVNQVVSAGLAAEGKFSGPSYSQKTLESRNLTNAQIRHAQYYRQGDTVIFHRGLAKHRVKPGASYVVHSVHPKTGKVVLLDGNRRLVLKPSELPKEKNHGISVYESGQVQMQAGLTIRWTANDRGRGIINSHTATVTKIENGEVSLRLKNGNEITLPQSDPQLRFLQMGYAMTSHGAQGVTTDRVFATFSGAAQFTTNQRSFYVSISRARHEAKLFVYDIKGTINKIRETTGAKLSALEALGTRASSFDIAATKDSGIYAPGPSLGERAL